MIRKPSRLRRWLKWVGLVVCLLTLGVTLVAWVTSHLGGVSWHTPNPPPWRSVVLNKGTVGLRYQGPGFVDERVGLPAELQREFQHQIKDLERYGVEDPTIRKEMRQRLLMDLVREHWASLTHLRSSVSQVSFLGFRWEYRRNQIGVPVDLTLRVPLWLPALVCMAILWAGPLRQAIRRRRRQQRRLRGRCESCNYDLTGNVTGLCPECGATTGRVNSGQPVTPIPDGHRRS